MGAKPGRGTRGNPRAQSRTSHCFQQRRRHGAAERHQQGVWAAPRAQTASALAFLGACGCAVAVGNALDSVKTKADIVVAHHAAGVAELATRLIGSDLSGIVTRSARIQPILGTKQNGDLLRLNVNETVLITGSSGGGKSTTVTALLEQMR